MVLGNGQWNPDRPSADFANKNYQEKDKTVITDSDKVEKKFDVYMNAKRYDNRGIRTLASEEIGTLILRLRPTRPDCLFLVLII